MAILYTLISFLVLLLFFLIIAAKPGRRRGHIEWDRHDESWPETSRYNELEDLVDRRLRVTEGHGGLVLNNCYLRWGNGMTTEIDNILICSSGVYVIECKDFSGWIFGDGNSENWMQTFAAGYSGDSIKQQFRNPILQNRNHVKCVRQKLWPMEVPIHNLVVFSDNCTLKDIKNVAEAYVAHPDGLLEAIRDIHLKYRGALSDFDMQKIYDILANDVVVTPELEEEHIRNVQRLKAQRYHERHGYKQ